MLVVWRILLWFIYRNNSENLDVGLPKISSVYDLYTFGSFRIIHKIKARKTLRKMLVGKGNTSLLARYLLFMGIFCPQIGLPIVGFLLLRFHNFPSKDNTVFICLEWFLYLNICFHSRLLRTRFKDS